MMEADSTGNKSSDSNKQHFLGSSKKPHTSKQAALLDDFEAIRNQQLKNLDRFVDNFMLDNSMESEQSHMFIKNEVKKYVKDAK
jgi:hypothetical protein